MMQKKDAEKVCESRSHTSCEISYPTEYSNCSNERENFFFFFFDRRPQHSLLSQHPALGGKVDLKDKALS